ncbi:hypothetical protein, partial [Mycobacterium marinum]|uniref:hypothetical protein n=1 Tax=Mycobacterium marinum TaxID=1781 RepID=UPI0021C39718
TTGFTDITGGTRHGGILTVSTDIPVPTGTTVTAVAIQPAITTDAADTTVATGAHGVGSTATTAT